MYHTFTECSMQISRYATVTFAGYARMAITITAKGGTLTRSIHLQHYAILAKVSR
jgi:hypothetical protein